MQPCTILENKVRFAKPKEIAEFIYDATQVRAF
jgi:hypothetical protein